jgi:hypothetical protein
VPLARDVVVVAVHSLRRRDDGTTERRRDGLDRAREHHVAVGPGVLLRPADGLQVVVEVGRPLGEVGEVAIREVHEPALHLAAGQLDEVVAGAERAELTGRARVLALGVLVRDVDVPGGEASPRGRRVCRASRSLSDAGRTLFAASRAQRTSVNDADRLRKYLARFGLDWERVSATG